MVTINQNYEKLRGNYLFSEIAKRVTAYGPVSYTHLDVYKRQYRGREEAQGDRERAGLIEAVTISS